MVITADCGPATDQNGCYSPKDKNECCIWCEGPDGTPGGICQTIAPGKLPNCPLPAAKNGAVKTNATALGCPTRKSTQAYCNCYYNEGTSLYFSLALLVIGIAVAMK